jgi:hypothetical protein
MARKPDMTNVRKRISTAMGSAKSTIKCGPGFSGGRASVTLNAVAHLVNTGRLGQAGPGQKSAPVRLIAPRTTT